MRRRYRSGETTSVGVYAYIEYKHKISKTKPLEKHLFANLYTEQTKYIITIESNNKTYTKSSSVLNRSNAPQTRSIYISVQRKKLR